MIARLFPEVRSVEQHRFANFFLLAALLLAGQAVGGTTAESLLLSRLGVQSLPTAMVAASLTTILGASLYSRWVAGRRGETSFLIMLGLGIGFLGLSIPLVKAGFSPVYIALFCFNWLTFTLYYGHFFALVGEYFDTLAMKRLLPLFVVGSTCGEIAGGLAASWVSSGLGAQGLLVLWMGCQAATAGFLWSLRPRLLAWNPPSSNITRRAKQAQVAPSGWAYIKRSSLGKSLALMAAAMMVTNTVVQYLHADIFLRSFPGEGQLASFLGMFTAVTNMVELVIGARLTPWLVRRFGVAMTNLVQPIGCLLTMLLLSWHYALIPAMLAWMNRKMLNDSMAAPTRAMVYSAFPARFRGPVRATVDGIFGAGSQCLAGVILGLLQQQMQVADLVWVGIVLSVFYVASAWRVRRVYLATLVDDLSQTRLSLPESSPRRPGPRRTTTLSGVARGELSGRDDAGPEELGQLAKGTDEAQALAALSQLRACADPLATVVLARSLLDSRPSLRQAASFALSQRGEAALPHLEPYFRATATASVEAAYEAVVNGGEARGREMLAQEIRLLVREALRHLFLAQAASRVEAPILKLALEDHCDRCRRLAFKVLSLLEGEHLMAPVMSSLRFADTAARANAMEVLSNLGDREAAGLLVLLTESSSLADKLASAARAVPSLAQVPSDREGLLQRCSHSSAPFVRRSAQLYRPGGEDGGMQRLAQLKTYDLFESLSLEELQGVAGYLVTERFAGGETVVEQGQPGQRLYLTVQGEVSPRMQAFGVTPLLDGEPQRFTVKALGPSTFWSLRAEHFHTLIGRYPEIGLALFRRLARQLKQQESRLKPAPE